MTDDVLKKKLAAIEERADRLQQSWEKQSQQKIVHGSDPKAELRLEALIESLENSDQGTAPQADETSKKSGHAESTKLRKP
jgi:hypothetical protein